VKRNSVESRSYYSKLYYAIHRTEILAKKKKRYADKMGKTTEDLSFVNNLAISVGGKFCITCKSVKHPDEFHKPNKKQCNRRCRDCACRIKRERYLRRGYSEKNKEYSRRRRLRNPTEDRSDLLREYGMTLEKYNQMLENQQGKCAICGGGREKQKYSFSVDHCHATGKIRGILCSNCNAGLGFFKDNPQSLTNAITYLISSGI